MVRAKCRGNNDHNKEIQRAERNVGKAVVHAGIAFLIILLYFAVPFCICEGTTVESTRSKLANTILARMHAYAHNIGARTRRTERLKKALYNYLLTMQTIKVAKLNIGKAIVVGLPAMLGQQ